MPQALQSLVHDGKTRVGKEVLWFFNLGKAHLIGKITKTGSGSEYSASSSCAGAVTVPAGHFLVARVTRYEGDTDLVLEDAGGSSVDITIPSGSPVGYSKELQNPIPDLSGFTGFTMTGGQAGDTVELWALPDPDNDTLICFDQGVSAKVGNEIKPIRRKDNPTDHYVGQVPENSIEIRELAVSNGVGVASLRGRDVTIIAKTFPDNIGTPCQIDYYTNCRFSSSKDTPEDVNASVTISSTGSFNKDLNFYADPS